MRLIVLPELFLILDMGNVMIWCFTSLHEYDAKSLLMTGMILFYKCLLQHLLMHSDTVKG